jgi:hypothetical protein
MQQSKKYLELEFLTITDTVQRKNVAHRKKVRVHAMNRYWQGRKEHAHLFSLPGHRKVRPAGPSPRCVCHGLGYVENGGAQKPCPLCGGVVSRRVHEQGDAHRWAVSNSVETSTVTQAGDCSRADKFSTFPQLGSPRVLGTGDRDPFSSFPVLTGQEGGAIEMLLRDGK